MPKKISSEKNFHVVAIGASAGGLEAIETFFKHLPVDNGLAFVVIQHLDPTHKGFFAEIVQRMTQLQVIQVKDKLKIQPDHVYVIPPNTDMSVLKGILYLTEPAAPRGMRLAIDHFFRSLADDFKERSIGIILSGMGTDGTLQIQAIKEKMGMTMAQEPSTAKYSDMPQSAIATGQIDFIAAAKELPQKLMTYLKHAATEARKPVPAQRKTVNALEKIFIMLKASVGCDFSLYKKSMICRRIERRMSIHQIEKIDDYVSLLQKNPKELNLLFNDFLIGVTNFFRDSEAFEFLKEKIIRIIMDQRKPGGSFRIWVPGCSTGEEAYSLAILCREILNETWHINRLAIQIFATDIDKNAIEKARLGIYPENIASDVSSERLDRFFMKEIKSYRIRKEIREMVVFAPQNILTDPPFTKLDILSCRNLLIYMTIELQKKIIPLFHYSLNTGGFLFLGHSETVSVFDDLFSPMDNRFKIYTRRDSAVSKTYFTDFPYKGYTSDDLGQKLLKNKSAEINIQSVTDKLLIETFCSPAVLIDVDGAILYISGHTGKYLEPSSGKAEMNIFSMAREGLRYELERAVKIAAAGNEIFSVKGLKVNTNGAEQRIDLRIIPVSEPEPLKGYLLVVFEDVKKIRRRRSSDKSDNAEYKLYQQRITDLENELQMTKEYLQSTSEEMRSSQEELRSTNEEIQSTNEELQSTNEELMTSREEMQSLNEELISVNAELYSKIDELTRLNNDMKNLLNSTDIATIFLDNGMNIRRFTDKASKIFKLIQTDVGRPITDIASDLDYDEMTDDAVEVLKTLGYKEIEIFSKHDHCYSVRIMPYRTSENIIDGVVMTFTDITKYKKMM